MHPQARAAFLAPTALVLLAAACGGAVAPPAAPTPEAPDASVGAPASVAPSTTTGLAEDAGLGTKLEPKKGEPGRSREEVGAAVQARRPDARRCYDEAASKNPALEGDVNVKWSIDPQGAVAEVTIDPEYTNLREPAVHKCIAAVIKALKFPASPKGLQTNAEYRFNFKRNAEQMRAARDAGL